MVFTTTMKKSAGLMRGRVTFVNCRQRPAPSMRADSYRSSGTACSAASRMITVQPTVHRPMMMSPGFTNDGYVVQEGPSMPIVRSIALISQYEPLTSGKNRKQLDKGGCH